jgi:hypothetical protein
MSDLEKMLLNKKFELDAIKAPEELESKLRQALQGKHRRRQWSLSKAAAVLLVISILAYNSSTLAFYGKQLLGYEGVMDGTLLELGRLGKGQQVDKSYIFRDGMKVQLDWVMLDGNGMVIFYTIEDTTKTRNIEDQIIGVTVKAPFFNSSSSGAGKILKDEYSQKWVLTTRDVPKFFVQTIKLDLSNQLENGIWEYGEISFKLDRSEALGETIRNRINKKIDLSGRTMTIESINMSPISTVVKGEIQDIISLGLDRMKGEALMPQALEMSLYADGVLLNRLGSGMSTNINGSRFEVIFDKLPPGTKSVELVLDKISVSEKLEETYTIKEGGYIEIMGNRLDILKIERSETSTMITISTDIGTRIPGTVLIADDEEYKLVETSESTFVEFPENKFSNIRTLSFEGIGEDLKLSIRNIIHTKNYEMVVYQEALKE